MKQEDLLKCPTCGTPFVNAVDSITGEISEYLFKPNCKCYKDGVIISMG